VRSSFSDIILNFLLSIAGLRHVCVSANQTANFCMSQSQLLNSEAFISLLSHYSSISRATLISQELFLLRCAIWVNVPTGISGLAGANAALLAEQAFAPVHGLVLVIFLVQKANQHLCFETAISAIAQAGVVGHRGARVQWRAARVAHAREAVHVLVTFPIFATNPSWRRSIAAWTCPTAHAGPSGPNGALALQLAAVESLSEQEHAMRAMLLPATWKVKIRQSYEVSTFPWVHDPCYGGCLMARFS